MSAEEPDAFDVVAELLDEAVEIVLLMDPYTGGGFSYLIGQIEERQKRWKAAPPPPFHRRPRTYFKKKQIPRSIAKVVMERDRYRCMHCGGWEDLAVDHIHPESKGGTLDLSNLQTLCRRCNRRKGARV